MRFLSLVSIFMITASSLSFAQNQTSPSIVQNHTARVMVVCDRDNPDSWSPLVESPTFVPDDVWWESDFLNGTKVLETERWENCGTGTDCSGVIAFDLTPVQEKALSPIPQAAFWGKYLFRDATREGSIFGRSAIIESRFLCNSQGNP